MRIGIVNYEMGNIRSLFNALNYIGHKPKLVSTKDEVDLCDIIVLPGVGAFQRAINQLRYKNLIQPIKKHVESNKKIIGICLGMQLFFENSLEFGDTKGFGFIKGKVKPFKEMIDLKIPHVGWNEISTINQSFQEFENSYYFIHSFYCEPENNEDVLFKSSYGIEFCSGVINKNIIGVQFHPEKSNKSGLSLLKKFLNE